MMLWCSFCYGWCSLVKGWLYSTIAGAKCKLNGFMAGSTMVRLNGIQLNPMVRDATMVVIDVGGRYNDGGCYTMVLPGDPMAMLFLK